MGCIAAHDEIRVGVPRGWDRHPIAVNKERPDTRDLISASELPPSFTTTKMPQPTACRRSISGHRSATVPKTLLALLKSLRASSKARSQTGVSAEPVSSLICCSASANRLNRSQPLAINALSEPFAWR